MSGNPTTFDDHDPLAYEILTVLEEFIDEIGHRQCTGHFEKVVDNKYMLKGKHLIQHPERFIEDHLVFPLLRDAFDHTIRPQPKQYAPRWPRQGGIPDFCVTTISIEAAMEADLRVFGEVKPPKKIENARNDTEEYLEKDIDTNALTILTDGFEWELWVRPRNTSLEEIDNPYAEASLKDPLKAVRSRNMSVEPYNAHTVRNRIDVDAFSAFTAESIRETIESEFDIDI